MVFYGGLSAAKARVEAFVGCLGHLEQLCGRPLTWPYKTGHLDMAVPS